MLLRAAEDGDDAIVCIGQPSHALVSGQLARAWAERPQPYEAVCLAAEQHDVGMAEWDRAPELDAETGRPQPFTRMALRTHLALWSAAPGRLLTQNRYAALLISLHGTTLYAARDLARLPDADAQAVRDYLADQRTLQSRLIETLRADPHTAAHATDDAIDGNRRLIRALDALSLAVLLRWPSYRITDVPAGAGAVVLTVASPPDEPATTYVDPWPFATPRVAVTAEGRRLTERYEDTASMHAALAAAPWVTVAATLTPRSSPRPSGRRR